MMVNPRRVMLGTKYGQPVSHLFPIFANHAFDSPFLSQLLEYTILTFIPKNLYEQFRR